MEGVLEEFASSLDFNKMIERLEQHISTTKQLILMKDYETSFDYFTEYIIPCIDVLVYGTRLDTRNSKKLIQQNSMNSANEIIVVIKLFLSKICFSQVQQEKCLFRSMCASFDKLFKFYGKPFLHNLLNFTSKSINKLKSVNDLLTKHGQFGISDDIFTTLCDEEPQLCLEHSIDLLSHLAEAFNVDSELNKNADDDDDENVWKSIVGTLLEALDVVEERLVLRILLEILPKLKTYFPEDEILLVVWQFTQKIINDRDGDIRVWVILGCISDLLFSCKLTNNANSAPIWMNCWFFSMIQRGLINDQDLHRKRSLYFLKRSINWLIDNENELKSVDKSEYECAIFSWNIASSRQASKIFFDFILVMETLEEKQLHVLKPLYPIIMKLLDSSNVVVDNTSLFHSSWAGLMLHRLLKHHTKTIRMWTLETLCELDFAKFPIFQQGTGEIIINSCIEALNDTTLFSTRNFKNDFSFFGNKLITLWKSFFIASTAQENGSCFKLLLQTIKNQLWGSVPIVYLFRSLSYLPHSPQWGLDEIEYLREVFEYTTRTHDLFLKSATQCYILETFLKLADVDLLNFSALSRFFGSVKTEDCFKRGTRTWKMTVKWLQNILFDKPKNCLNKEMAICYLNEGIKTLFTTESGGKTIDSRENFQLVRMLVLLVDAGVLDLSKEKHPNSLNRIMSTLTSTLQTCFNLPQACNGVLADVSVQLLLNLILLSEHIKNHSEVQDELFAWVNNLVLLILPVFLPFVKIRLTENNLQELKNVDHYFQFLKCIVHHFGDHLLVFDFVNDLCQIQLSFLKSDILGSRQNNYVAAKCFQLFYTLYTTSNSHNIKHKLLAEEFAKVCCTGDFLITIAPTQHTLSFTEMKHTVNTNQMSSLYLSMLWDCMASHLRLFPEMNHIIIDHAHTVIDIGGTPCIQPVLKCLKLILPQYMNHKRDLVATTLESCWKIVCNMKLNLDYWVALESFVDMAYQAPFLNDQQTTLLLQQYAKELSLVSESTHKIVIRLFKKVSSIWYNDVCPTSIMGNLELLILFLSFGISYPKDLKVLQETVSFLTILGSECSANEILKSNQGIGSEVRSGTIILLFSLRNKEWSSLLYEKIVLELVAYDRKVTSEKTRHFTNSRIHRTQLRVWQYLLLIETVLNQEMATSLLDIAFKKLGEDSLQPSVKFFVEWIIVKILYKYPQKLVLFWEMIDTSASRRFGILSSLSTVMCSLGSILRGSSQVTFVETALNAVLPWCMSSHHNTRIHAQIVLRKLWEICKQFNLSEIIERLAVIDSLLGTKNPNQANIKVGSSGGVKHLLNDFRFRVFNPLKHFTFETIFYEVPRIFNVIEDEWIPAPLFKTACVQFDIETLNIDTFNTNAELASCEPYTSISMIDDAADDQHKDVQKKLTPWKSMFPDLETLKESLLNPQENSTKSDLILVASLIDRPPNLGGLCRTCEIFGVAEFVINNLSYVADKSFQSLSVSADRWVHIKEVKVVDLKSYLLFMKNAGYLVVGAEQTANSIKLTNYNFKKKTVLVLGNEKDGIPVDIIQLLDVAVEVPQRGVIRSLNVHVTGAIIIWEYTRQQLFDIKY